ncbi:hypothetical protein FALBO_12814 [Fusarium albosuccineum]|uniref:Zn(2)-C6 fungal-type domain-containing protein n=1 Tax=Fusarium albosuccineum TaxID=1237068 RepID=A0A8H4PGV2_9HYPO|nr:hypothetical protein FALBO_12814 [Fusarium albosuccineum]
MSRSKTGCITCRIRRVKCDETKPECNRCRYSKRVCDGYLPEDNFMSRRQLADRIKTLSVVGPVSRALSHSPSSSNPLSRPVSPNDTIYFDLFRRATVPSTCNLFPSSFWQETVMQLAHIEPAIWHAAVTLGTLHQKAEELSQGKGVDALSHRAITHYGKAMALAKDLDSPTKIVTLPIALVGAANMNGTHIQGLGVLGGSLMRVDVLAMTFSDSDSPYPYEESTSVFALDQFLQTPCIPPTSYEYLSSELFSIVRAFSLLDDGILSGSISYGPWLTKLDAFTRRLIEWETNMARLALRLYHVSIRVMLRATSFGLETRYDSILGYFEYAIRLAVTLQKRIQSDSSVNLTLEPGLMIPLWMTIHRCRHYQLRRAALKILTDANMVEAMWRSDATAKILRTVVALEKESLVPISVQEYNPVFLDPSAFAIPWSAWSRPSLDLPTSVSWNDVPAIQEERRVKEILGTTRLSERRVELRLLICPSNDVDPYGPVKELTVHL